jgi:hypothetical protein
MASGFKTGGRRRGTPNKASAAKAAEVRSSGLTPLDYMVSVMRNKKLPLDRRLEAAKSAAPYIHPKLASVAVKSEDQPGSVTNKSNFNIAEIEMYLEMPPLERAKRVSFAIETIAREHEESRS